MIDYTRESKLNVNMAVEKILADNLGVASDDYIKKIIDMQ